MAFSNKGYAKIHIELRRASLLQNVVNYKRCLETAPETF